MDEKLRVGILGVGMYAMAAHVPLLKMTGRATIAAVCRRNEKLLAMAQEHSGAEEAYTDWREMLDKAKLDAVVVSTPHSVHTEPVIAALDRGLHVLVDKPMALTSKDAWAMVEAGRRADRMLMVAYRGRMTAQSRVAKAVLDQGRIGQVRQIVVTHFTRYNWWFEARVVPDSMRELVQTHSGMPDEFFHNWVVANDYWRGDVTQSGGGLFVDGGTHAADKALWLGGAPATEVVSFMDAGTSKLDRYVSVQARLANGVLVTLTMADIDSELHEDGSWTIVGDDGVLTMNGKGIWIETEAGREDIQPVGPDLYPQFPFVSCILDGAPNPIPGEEGAYAVALIEAAYRSADEKTVVQLTLPS
jgi:predicted dehydrogenase